MSGSRSVTASFTTDLVPETVLSVNTEGNGVVSSSPAGISCPEDCSQAYTKNEAVVLTANPGEGQFFVGWSGDCSGNGGCTVVMSSDRSVTALFDSENPATDVLLSVELAGTGSGELGDAGRVNQEITLSDVNLASLGIEPGAELSSIIDDLVASGKLIVME